MHIKTNNRLTIIAIVAAALMLATATASIRAQPAAAAATATTGGGTATSSTGQQTFTATMTGGEEVPPKNTKATGSAKFVSSSDGNSMTYRIRVVNINGVTMAHIHSGRYRQEWTYCCHFVQVSNSDWPNEWTIVTRDHYIC